jgi:class 3 adenylate cyclase/tetratricopeptide (TPR) repeat protein
VDCARCGKTNRDDRRFCTGCGAPLVAVCPRCADELDPGAAFCGACGLDLRGGNTAPPEAVGGTRKVVTIAFADLVGSTALHERLDAESVRRVMQRYYDALRAVVEAHDGTVVKLMGDGVMVAFGVPHVGEDDALRAVRCAMAMQHDFASLHAELGSDVGMGLRVAVNSGEVAVRDDDQDVVGDPVNVAARLQQEASVGEVVIGEATRRLVGSLVTLQSIGALALKGRVEAVSAYRVVSMDPPPTARSTSFVGREDELSRLLARYRSAQETQHVEFAVVLGSPGLGKSRMLAEVSASVADEACVVSVSCTPGAATFAPLAEGLRVLAGIDDQADSEVVRAAIEALVIADAPDRARVIDGISALLSGAPPPLEETFYVVRRLAGLLGAAQPVVLMFDDVHWAQPLLLDLIEHLVEWTRDIPVLVLVAGRPELRDVRSSLAMPGRLLREVVSLEGLDASAAARLAAEVVGADELPAGVAGPVLTASDGNPLFVGELVRMLVDDGTLRRDHDRWTATVDLTKLELPPTIHALLAARIERLRVDECTVLERAAVIGAQFSRAALNELVPSEVRAGLDAHLEALRRAELIDPDAGWFLGEPMLRFHHVLIREAAYHRMLKETRAELHVRFADWVAAHVPDVAEYDELLGLHLEAARDCRADLGASDADVRVLGDRAATHLAAAGRRALARDDVAAAASLLGRGVRCQGADDETRAALALDWCEALLSAGDVDQTPAAIAELAGWASTSSRLSSWLTCFRAQLAVLTDPVALRDNAAAVADAATQLAAVGDDAGEAKAYSVQAQALAGLGEIGACETALDHALVAARRVRDWRRANAVLAGAPAAQLWGPSPLTRASGRCLDVVRVLRITSGSAAVEAVALRSQSVLETLRGRASAARRMLTSSRATVEELGLTQRVLEADLYAGIVELYDANPAAAEAPLRAAYEGLREHGLADAGLAAALLGRAALEQGRVDEAETLSHESETLAGQGLKAAIAWRSLRAETLAARGEHEAALDYATAAVSLAASTDLLLDHADSRLAMATVLRAAGRSNEGDAEIARAVELWETKGATALIDRVAATRFAGAPQTGAGQRGSERSHRRVRENAVTRAQREIMAAFAAGDMATLERLTPPDAVWVNHPTGREYDTTAALAFLRSMLDAGDSHLSYEPLATLGDRLALFRIEWTVAAMTERHLTEWGISSGGGFGVVEVDHEGHERRYELFGDQLDDAIGRLYELYADELPVGVARQRAAAVASSLRDNTLRDDAENWAATLAPDVELVDRRRLGLGSFHGRDVHELGIRLFADLATSISFTVEDVLALDATMQLSRFSISGVDRATGGNFDTTYLNLMQYREGGEIARIEMFDLNDVEAAFARFDELTNSIGAASSSVVDTTATRVQDAIFIANQESDWDAWRSLCAPTMVWHDRRRGVHLDGDVETLITSAQFAFEKLNATVDRTPIATRGDLLALERMCFTFTDDLGGVSVGEVCEIIEADRAGVVVRYAVFDSDDLDTALRELDAWYLASEPRARTWFALVAALNDRDWDTVERCLAPEAVFDDHRSVSVLSAHGRDRVVALWRSLVEFTPEIRLVTLHLEAGERNTFAVYRWQDADADANADDDGRYEARCVVVAHGGDGRMTRFEIYGIDDLNAARTRLAQLSRAIPSSEAAFANAATRARDALTIASRADDSPKFPVIDRRREPATDATERADRHELLATREQQHALYRSSMPDVERLELYEVDDRGRIVRVTLFDGDDLDVAYRALDDAGGTGDDRLGVALSSQDWDQLREQTALDVVMEDHRSVGLFTLRGRDELLRIWQGAFEAIPDARVRADHVITRGAAKLVVARWIGTRDGVEFNAPRVAIYQTDADGRVCRIDTYDLAQLDEARASFDELAVGRRADVVPSNAAGRVWDEWRAALQARDWNRAGALCSREFRFVDHTRAAHVELDLERFIEMIRYVATDPNFTRGWRLEAVASFGERVLVGYTSSSGGSAASGWDWESLTVTELDADGLICASVMFEVSDRRAALAEARARFLRGEGAATRHVHDAIATIEDLFRARDWAGMRALQHPDFPVIHDHRRLRILPAEQTGEEQTASLLELAQLAPDIDTETLRIVEWNERGALMLQRTWGTFESGSAFENLLLDLIIIDAATNRVLAQELFDTDDIDTAITRFRAFGRDSVHLVRPNAASRALSRSTELIQAGDWDGVRALSAPDYAFQDRTRLGHVTIDRETALEMARQTAAQRYGMDTAVIATFGDRIAVTYSRFSGRWATGAWDYEQISVVQVDINGLMTATTMFEVEDRKAALAEAHARFFADEGASTPDANRATATLAAAIEARDWVAYRAQLADDFRMRDHRRPALLSEQGPDEYVASLAALAELAPDVRPEMFGVPAWSQHGSVMLLRAEGTAADGGPFENLFALVHAIDTKSGRSVALELFDIDDIDSALARFAELSVPDPLRIAPNAATRTFERYMQALDRRDWDAIASLFDPGYEYSDRRTGVHLDGGTEMMIATARFAAQNTVFGENTVVAHPTLLAALGDHVCLLHVVWTTPDDAFNNEMLIVAVAGTDERASATILFDVGDRAAAETELLERAAPALPTGAVALFRGWNTHDLDAIRAAVHDDLVFDDQRRTGVGLIEGTENYLASFAAFVEQSPDFFTAPLTIIAANPRGYLALVRNFGTVDGGAYEQVALRINVFEDGKARRFEQFEPEDLELALARFHELCDESSRDAFL